MARDLIMLRRWTKLLITCVRHFHGSSNSYERIAVPNAVAEWRDYMPARFYYMSTGGLVELENSTQKKFTMDPPQYDIVTAQPWRSGKPDEYIRRE